MDPPDPIEAIKFRMEQQGLTRKDLEGILGTRTQVAEVLNRRQGAVDEMPEAGAGFSDQGTVLGQRAEVSGSR